MTTRRLFPVAELAEGEPRRVEVDGHAVVLVRIDDDVYALEDRCSHADVALSEGFVEVDDRQIECERHGALFDLATGEPCSLPATRPVPTHDVAVVDGHVEITIAEAVEEAS